MFCYQTVIQKSWWQQIPFSNSFSKHISPFKIITNHSNSIFTTIHIQIPSNNKHSHGPGVWNICYPTKSKHVSLQTIKSNDSFKFQTKEMCFSQFAQNETSPPPPNWITLMGDVKAQLDHCMLSIPLILSIKKRNRELSMINHTQAINVIFRKVLLDTMINCHKSITIQTKACCQNHKFEDS